MEYRLHKSRIQYLIQRRNGYLVLAIGSMIINILQLLVIFAILGHERIIIVPPNINRSFWVSASQVSPEYLSEMAYYFVQLRFNMTPSNAASQRDLLLRYVLPRYYGALKTELLSEADRITKEHITTAFYQNNIQVDTRQLLAKITGDLQTSVGDAILPMQRVIYQISFTYDSGRLLIKSFEEVNSHA